MVIRKQDRVSDVLRNDESLIDVFVALSPAFERLRNRALRKVMARLVTVEQAANMGGVDADELVARLNAGSAGTPMAAYDDSPPDRDGEGHAAEARDEGAPTAHAAADAPASPLPPALAALSAARVVDVDARDDLRNGREPFSRIMAARRQVPEGGALRVRVIFEPVPLYAAMARQGLAHHTERLGPEDWRVWFYRDAAGGTDAASGPDEAVGADAADQPDTDGAPEAHAADDDRPANTRHAADADGAVVVLDVRGLEPPEPMVRTLAALETLPPDATLVQINVRVPQFLLPQLEERGFAYEIREQQPDLVRVFIQRAEAP